jgi:hypothetical protein
MRASSLSLSQLHERADGGRCGLKTLRWSADRPIEIAHHTSQSADPNAVYSRVIQRFKAMECRSQADVSSPFAENEQTD